MEWSDILSNPDFLGAVIGGIVGAIISAVIASLITIYVERRIRISNALKLVDISERKTNDLISRYDLVNKSTETINNIVITYNYLNKRNKERVKSLGPHSNREFSIFEYENIKIRKTRVPVLMQNKLVFKIIDFLSTIVINKTEKPLMVLYGFKMKYNILIMLLKFAKEIKTKNADKYHLALKLKREEFGNYKSVYLELVQNFDTPYRSVCFRQGFSIHSKAAFKKYDYYADIFTEIILYIMKEASIKINYEVENSVEGFVIPLISHPLNLSYIKAFNIWSNFIKGNIPIEYFTYSFYQNILKKSPYQNLRTIVGVHPSVSKSSNPSVVFWGEAPIEGFLDKAYFINDSSFKFFKMPQIKKKFPNDLINSVTDEQILFIGDSDLLRRYSLMENYFSNEGDELSIPKLLRIKDNSEASFLILNLRTGEFITTDKDMKPVIGVFEPEDLFQTVDILKVLSNQKKLKEKFSHIIPAI